MFKPFHLLIASAVRTALENETKASAYGLGIKAGFVENKSLWDNPYDPSSPEFEAWRKGLLRGIMNKTIERKSKK